MKKEIAKELIIKKLSEYRIKDYLELKELINQEPTTGEITHNNVVYHFEVQAFWDSRKSGDIRIIGNIDDGGIRAYRPLSSDFIKTRNNTFVGE